MSGRVLQLSVKNGPHWLSQPGPSDTALVCVAGGASFQLPLPLLAAVSPLLQQLLQDKCYQHQQVILLPMVTKNTITALAIMLDKGGVVVQSKSRRMKRKLEEVMAMLGIVGEINDFDDIEEEAVNALNREVEIFKEKGESSVKNDVDLDEKCDNLVDSPDHGVRIQDSADDVNDCMKEKVVEENYFEEKLASSQYQVNLKVSFPVDSPIVNDLCHKIDSISPLNKGVDEIKDKEEANNEAEKDNLPAQEGDVKYQFDPLSTQCARGKYPGCLTVKHSHQHHQAYSLNKVYHSTKAGVTLYYVCLRKKAGCKAKCTVVQRNLGGRLDLVRSSSVEEHNHAIETVI